MCLPVVLEELGRQVLGPFFWRLTASTSITMHLTTTTSRWLLGGRLNKPWPWLRSVSSKPLAACWGGCAGPHLEERVPHVVVLLAHLHEAPPLVDTAFAAAAGERGARLHGAGGRHTAQPGTGDKWVDTTWTPAASAAVLAVRGQGGDDWQSGGTSQQRCEVMLVLVLPGRHTSLRLSPTASSITLSPSA